MLHIGWRAGFDGGGGGCNTTPPKPLGGDFLFALLFVGLLTLQGGVLFGVLYSLEQKKALPPPGASTISGAALLSSTIPSLQAWYEKQHLIFFVESSTATRPP